MITDEKMVIKIMSRRNLSIKSGMKNDTKTNLPYATLKEACEYLRVSYGYGRHVWVEWKEKYGVRVSRIGKRIVIPYSDLDSMITQLEVH